PQQELVAPGQHAAPDHVARDRAHHEDDADGGQEAESGDVAPEDPLIHRREHVVDPAPEDPEEPRGEKGGDGADESRDESDVEPVPHAEGHGFFEDSTSRYRVSQTTTTPQRTWPSVVTDRDAPRGVSSPILRGWASGDELGRDDAPAAHHAKE